MEWLGQLYMASWLKKKEIPLTKIYDCFGSTKEFVVCDYYKSIQEYTYKIVCECNGEKSPSTT